MNKTIFVAVVALAMGTLFTSCKKEQSCECTYNVGGQSMSQTYKLGKVSKSSAKDACKTHETQVAAMGTSASCSVK